MHNPTDRKACNGLCYISHVALAGTRNGSTMKDRSNDPFALTTEPHLSTENIGLSVKHILSNYKKIIYTNLQDNDRHIFSDIIYMHPKISNAQLTPKNEISPNVMVMVAWTPEL